MFRKLSLAVALALGVTPFGANALGLGDIHLKSALNQYFNADIDLLSVDQGEIADVRVSLASIEAFRRAGLDRSFILTKLRFQPEIGASGEAVIRVSSRDPIREPFLNFLIEVNWPKGKLLREYTVLLDPPVTLDRKPAPIQPARARTAPAVSSGGSVVSPRDVAWAGGPTTAQADEYGPTQKNDTLWGIATSVRHQGASMEQTMIALFHANPHAFMKQNINNLRVGKILRVPDRDEVMALSAAEARAAYREQLHSWQADRKPEAAETEMAGTEAAVSPAEPVEMTPEAELKIATARPEGKGEAGPSESMDAAQVVENLQQDLLLAQEAKESALQEGEELRDRVTDLESQLDDLQRLLELKSDQLAQMQAAVKEKAEGQMAAPAPAVQEPEPAQAPAPAKPAAPSAVKERAAQTVKPAKPQQPRKPSRQEEKGLLDMILGDTTMLGIAIGSGVVLLALLWVVISRRRSGSSDFQESILVSTIDDADSDDQLDDIAPEPVSHPTEETSFLSDFSPSDIDALQDETGEVDPLAEADVYIAYGRYQQAEELIRQAIEKNPDRSELKFKLFEILSATKDSDGFIALSEQGLAEGLDSKDRAAWGKVLAMGALLAPAHDLFAGADASDMEELASGEEKLASLEDEFDFEEDFDLDSLSTDLQSGDEGDADELGGLDDLGDLGDLTLDADTDSVEPATDEKAEVDNDLEDSLSLDDLDDFSSLDAALDLPDESAAGEEDSLNLADFGGAEEQGAEPYDLADIEEPSDETVPGLDLPGDEEAGLLGDELDLDDLSDDTRIGLDMKPPQQEPESESLSLDDLEEGPDALAQSLEELSGGDDDADELMIEDTLESAELDDLELPHETAAPSGAEEIQEPVISLDDSASARSAEEELAEDSFDSVGLNVDSDSLITELDDLGMDDSISLDDLDMDDMSLPDGEEVVDEVNTKLDLARAYVDMGDMEGARSILEEVKSEGNEGQQQEARQMLDDLS
jgi:pilus assembly protein FimV